MMAVNPVLPDRLRCSECDPVHSTGKGPVEKATPHYDALALYLARLIMRGSGLDLNTTAARFVLINGAPFKDEGERARIYGAVGCSLIDCFADGAHERRVQSVRTALRDWSIHPNAQTRGMLRRKVRTLYSAQHRADCSWYTARGVIGAAKIASPPEAATRAVSESLSYLDRIGRDNLHQSLRSMRRTFDSATISFEDSPALQDIARGLMEDMNRELVGFTPSAERLLPHALQLVNAYETARAHSTREVPAG